MAPLFTIITATYNVASTLPNLLESLAHQTYRDFELIIQDGTSTDDTLAILEQYNDKIPHLCVQSEKDTGIYDAWNKALPRIKGKWVLFLGADDRLAEPSTLQKVYSRLTHAPANILFACGGVSLVNHNEVLEYSLCPDINRGKELLFQGEMPVPHPGLFHHCTLFDQNRFITSFHIAGDYELLCRTWPKKEQLINLNLLTAHMAMGGISDNPLSTLQVRWEIIRVLWLHNKKGISLKKHIIPLGKGLILYTVCIVLGKKNAPKVLDKIRVLRGLPPTWQKKQKYENLSCKK